MMTDKQELNTNALVTQEEEQKELEDKLHTFLCHRAQRKILAAWRIYLKREEGRQKVIIPNIYSYCVYIYFFKLYT